MTREIKFRGKRIDNGEWVYGYYWHDSLTNRHLITVLEWCRGGWNIEVDPKTVGQYTGLKDKNGVEIYEGDIVRYDKTVYVVEFINQSYEPLCYYNNAKVEVIGNIHENGDLLQ